MAALTLAGVRVSGIVCTVPTRQEGIETDSEQFGAESAKKISDATGVRSRYVVDPGMCTSDLCQAAAEQLLDDLQWDRESIQALVFVSQTPDYLLPATSCCLQKRLELGSHCATFDINLGCSGYVYGLWLAGQLAASGLKRVLLLVGDTVSRITDKTDRSTRPLFGDAGTATALEADPAAAPWYFNLGSDGGGEQHLIVRQRMFRNSTDTSQDDQPADDHLFMDGPEIFTFAVREAPEAARAALVAANTTIDNIDAVVMHQANLFLLKHLGKRLSIPTEKLPVSLDRYGNTSAASIPLTLADRLATRCEKTELNLLLLGFGVGYSWGAAAIKIGPIPKPRILSLSPSFERGVIEERSIC